jgi:hypothetical protein
MSSTDNKNYIKYLNLQNDPFPITAPDKANYWSDNRRVLRDIIDVEMQSIRFATSSIYIFWGPIGTGKTFAASFLSNSKTIQRFLVQLEKPTDFKVKVIKIDSLLDTNSDGMINSIHRKLVKSFFYEILSCENLKKEFIDFSFIANTYIKKAFENIKTIIKEQTINEISFKNIFKCDGYQFMIQNNNTIGKADGNDLSKIIELLIKIMKKKYDRITIIIDDMENIAQLKVTEKLLFNDYILQLYKAIDTHLNFILIFNFDTFQEVEQCLNTAISSRIKKKVEFSLIDSYLDIKEYIQECIKHRTNKEITDIMDTDVLDKISRTLINKFNYHITFKQINIEMQNILNSIYVSNKSTNKKITLHDYEKCMESKIDVDMIKGFKNNEQLH